MQEVIQLIGEGHSAAEVARITGRSLSGVYWIAKQNGVAFHKKDEGIDAQIRKMRAAGQSYSSIASVIGCSHRTVQARCRKLGIEVTETETKERARRIQLDAVREKCAEFGFEYIDGYEGRTSIIRVRCAAGHITERGYHSFWKGHCRCRVCAEIERAEWKAERQAAKEIEAERRKADEHRQRLLSLPTQQLEMRACETCGCLFIPVSKLNRYCSQRCNDRMRYRRKDLKRRHMIARARVDAISLEKLFDTDGGICSLCGTACDWNDYKMDGDTFIAGPMYPSVDHVIPLSKGGAHAWNNVKLAHCICNALKGNKVVPGHQKIVS